MKNKKGLNLKQKLKENCRKQKVEVGKLNAAPTLNMYYRLADEGFSPAKLGNL